MKLIVDRFEGDFAVCEKQKDGKMINILKDKLPKNIKEGDYLRITDQEVIIDYDKRKAREEKIKNLMDDLWEN